MMYLKLAAIAAVGVIAGIFIGGLTDAQGWTSSQTVTT
jgi:hypothetical protein